MPQRPLWADQFDDSDQEMSVDIQSGANASGALVRNRSVDSNATHMSWDDSNTTELLHHLEKSSDMPQVHQSLGVPQGVPAQCVPPMLPSQFGPVFLMPVPAVPGNAYPCATMPGLAQMSHAPNMLQSQAGIAQCPDPAAATASWDAGMECDKHATAAPDRCSTPEPQVQRQPRLGRRRSSRTGLGPFAENTLVKPLRKRRSSTMKDFKESLQKRSREEFGELLDNTENQPCNAAAPQPEEATEEVWQHRIQKRNAAVSMIKATPEYQGCLARQGSRRPATPNPFDRSVSKRQWEGKVVGWRTGLREGC